MSLHFKNIRSLIISGNNRFSKWMGYFGLFIGVLLLLISIQLFFNIQGLLKEENPRKFGYDYVSISRNITNENMGRDNSFSKSDIQQLEAQPQIEGVSPLISNQYRVRASAGNVLPFSTDLFLESLDNSFIDTVPPTFTWKEGQVDVPLIFSSDFLEMYNVFAPAQGLPQVSPKTISSINIFMECSGPFGTQNFRGNIVALSDRINSILVPSNFMNWSNYRLTGDTTVRASRVYIKTKDANDPHLISYLDSNNFHINKDKIRFGRLKGFLQNIVSTLGIFGILIIVIALMLFSFYLQLMIAKSKDNLKLLLTLGYSPSWLAKSVAQTWLPVYLIVIVIALAITQIAHLVFRTILSTGEEKLPFLLHPAVWITSIVLFLITMWLNTSLVKKELNQIS